MCGSIYECQTGIFEIHLQLLFEGGNFIYLRSQTGESAFRKCAKSLRPVSHPSPFGGKVDEKHLRGVA